jgi:hypothetical protein
MSARRGKRRAALVLLLLIVGGALLLVGAHQAASSEAALPPIFTITVPITINPTFYPNVTSVSPVSGAVDVPTDTLVHATFDRDMDAFSIKSDSFYLETRSSLILPLWVLVPANLSYNPLTHTAALNPTSDLQAGKTYRVTLTSDIRSSTLFHLSGAPVTWTFTTVSPPSVTGRTPSVGATDVPLAQVVSVSFDRAMNAATLTAANFNIKKSGGSPLPATVNYSPATLTVTLAPAADLEPASTYVVSLSPGVLGANGLPVAGAPITWSFTSVAAAPLVTGLTPTNGATGRPLDQVMSVSFDKDMDASTITSATLYVEKSGGTPLPATVAYSAATRTASLDPLADLEAGATYQVTLSTAVKGAMGLSVVGAPIVWSFSTETGVPVFTDVVPGVTPYAAAIGELATRGIITGLGGGIFGPQNPVMRQQFAKMIVLTMGYEVPPGITCPFTDVDPIPNPIDPLYPAKYVAVCASQGVTTGKTATTFDPYSNITRFQVITMVVRAMDNARPGLLTTPPTDFVPTWSPSSSAQHGQNAARAEYHGLLAGLPLNSLNPTGFMPRGEVAQILYNLIGLLAP